VQGHKGKAKMGVNSEANGAFASQIQILRSLRRSRVRTEIVMYLYEIYPKASYATNIAGNTKIATANVLGGLRGMGKGFAKSKSLLELGLVDKIEDDDRIYYQLSKLGKSLIENLVGG